MTTVQNGDHFILLTINLHINKLYNSYLISIMWCTTNNNTSSYHQVIQQLPAANEVIPCDGRCGADWLFASKSPRLHPPPRVLRQPRDPHPCTGEVWGGAGADTNAGVQVVQVALGVSAREVRGHCGDWQAGKIPGHLQGRWGIPLWGVDISLISMVCCAVCHFVWLVPAVALCTTFTPYTH